MKEFKTLQEFWPFYLVEHANIWNRRLHFVGSLTGLVLFALSFYLENYYLIGAAFISGYLFAWIGHFFIEKNKPATFEYPLKSFLSDWIMFLCILTGKIDSELAKAKKIMATENKELTENPKNIRQKA